MKTAFVSLLALGSASAFAPSQTASKATQLSATAELDGLIGVDLETGKKIVSGGYALVVVLMMET